MRASAGVWFAIASAGLGIGWLVGLSTSPVVASVIATLLAAAAALASASTANEGSATGVLGRISPGKLAALVVGIAVGATCGLESRVAGWFSARTAPVREAELKQTIDRWEALGANRADVIQRLLDRALPIGSGGPRSASESPPAIPVGLVAGALPAGACGEMRSIRPGDILPTLAASTNSDVRALAEEAIRMHAPESLAIRLRDVLCPRK